MTSIEFIKTLNDHNLRAFPRKIELSVADLTNAGLEPSIEALAAINTIIASKNKQTNMDYTADDLGTNAEGKPNRAFVNRGNYIQGKILEPKQIVA